MIPQASCPSPARLRELLDGTLPEAEQATLTGHLDACARCRQALEGLAVEGGSYGELARKLGRPDTDPPGLRRALDELKEPRAGAETAAYLSTDGGPALSFLGPSDRPGHLGRLGPYEVLEVIGRGGMGVVLKAIDPTLDRVVAIKVLAPHLAASAAARRRFSREAQAGAAVSHDHVVTIHVVKESDGQPYLVMQYIAGISLQEKIERTGPLELKEILRIVHQAACGLAAAHAQGLIHRDIKPANILLENGVERVKITDFGLARAADDASLSQSGVVAGTPNYMAPEQARGEAVDHRADLFGLGSVLYAMCTGRPPFRARDTMAVLKRVREDTPRPVREVNPDIPEWLAEIIAKLQAKAPADRFESATEVAELLGRHLAHLEQPSVVPMPRRLGRRGDRRRAVLGTAAAGLLVLLGGLSLTEATGVIRLRESVAAVFAPRHPDEDEIAGAGTELPPPAPPDLPAEPDLPPEPVGEVRRFEGHTNGLWGVAFSPDGRYALTGSGEAKDPSTDNTVRLWVVRTGRELRRFEGHTRMVSSVALSSDGGRALSGSWDRTVRLWDVGTGQELRRIEGHEDSVTSVAFSPDGTRALSGSQDRTARLWDLEGGRELRRFDGHAGIVRGVAFSPDGRHVLSGSWDRTIRLWDVASGKELQRFEGHTGWVTSVAFSPDGLRALSSGSDRTVRLWDLAKGKELLRLDGHKAPVTSVAFTPDGQRAVSGSDDDTVRLWDLQTGQPLHLFAGHGSDVRGVAVSPDGLRALSGSWDRTARLWRLPDPTGQAGEPRR